MLTRSTPSQPLSIGQVLETAEQACEGSCGNAEPWFPHLYDGIPNTSYLFRVVQGLNELIHLACLAQGLAEEPRHRAKHSPSPSAKPESAPK